MGLTFVVVPLVLVSLCVGGSEKTAVNSGAMMHNLRR